MSDEGVILQKLDFLVALGYQLFFLGLLEHFLQVD